MESQFLCSFLEEIHVLVIYLGILLLILFRTSMPGQGHIQSATCLSRDLAVYWDGRARNPWKGVARHSLLSTVSELWEACMHSRKRINSFETNDPNFKCISEDLRATRSIIACLFGRLIRKRKASSVQASLILVLHILGNLSQGSMKKIYPKGDLIVFKYLVCALNKTYNVFSSWSILAFLL